MEKKCLNNITIIFYYNSSSHKILVICINFSPFGTNKLLITKITKDLPNFVINLAF